MRCSTSGLSALWHRTELIFVSSKYATIGLGGMLLLCVLVCLATTGKIGFLHYKHTIRKKLAQWTGNEAGVREHTAKEAEWRAEWDVDSYDMDATISAET